MNETNNTSSATNTILIVIVILLIAIGGFALWYRTYQVPATSDTSGARLDIDIDTPGGREENPGTQVPLVP